MTNGKKDGKKYIQFVDGHKNIDDPRNGGYNFTATMTFASMEDFKYYDEEDAAHDQLKAWAKSKVAGPPLVFYSETK